MYNYFFDIIIILTLIACNGILAMVEFAIVSSNRAKIETLSNKILGAKTALELMNNPGSFLSTIQVGITSIGIIAGAFGGRRFAEPFGPWLNEISWIYGHGEIIAYGVMVLVITYVTIVFGELIPKRIAIASPERVACALAGLIRLLSIITRPFVVILDLSTKAILIVFNHNEKSEEEVTQEDIHSFIKQGYEEGAIDNFEHALFHKVLRFGDREASIIMTPRDEVVYLDIANNAEENLHKILQNPHRYYPVFENGLDNFKGIIDTKDMLTQRIQGKEPDFKSLIKSVPCVIEDNLGPDLIDKFKKYKTHLAVVVDKNGTMKGIITLVDFFEALVGFIPDFGLRK